MVKLDNLCSMVGEDEFSSLSHAEHEKTKQRFQNAMGTIIFPQIGDGLRMKLVLKIAQQIGQKSLQFVNTI
jgi:hypothetical protein